MAAPTKTVAGFTNFNKQNGTTTASGVIIQDTAGNGYGLWVDTTGDLRVGAVATVEGASFNPNSDGTIVGTQS
jgi:hypothetical protein